jgi:hypothetical protein
MPPKKQGEGAEARYNAKKPTVSFRVYSTGMKDAIYAQAKRKGLSVSAYLSDLIAADLDGKKPKPKRNKAQRSTPELDIPDYADEMLAGAVHPDMPQWDKENETYAEYQKRYFEHLNNL